MLVTPDPVLDETETEIEIDNVTEPSTARAPRLIVEVIY